MGRRLSPNLMSASGCKPLHDDLQKQGITFLPGWAHFLESLSPLNCHDAWAALSDPHTISTLSDHPNQRGHFTLTDEGGIELQATIGVAIKKEKTHLTLVAGGENVASNPLLPSVVSEYLQRVYAFQRSMTALIADTLQPSSLPTTIQTRIFDYHASDLLAGLRGASDKTLAMRPHVDGTVITIIIAESSDRALLYRCRGEWKTIARGDGLPFAVAMTGTAAFHDLGLQPILHEVLPCADRRISIVTRLAPDLGTGTREQAECRLAQWRIAKPPVFQSPRRD
jgi:hypothetical protein